MVTRFNVIVIFYNSILTGLFPLQPDQMIINHYTPGQGDVTYLDWFYSPSHSQRALSGINPHVDKTHCFDGVVGSVGMGSSCIMEFR